MLYKNTKVKVRSPDGDTDFFDIVAGIIYVDYVLLTSVDLVKENGFMMAKARNRRYPAGTITDVKNADDIALLANTPTRAEFLLHSLELTAGGIGFLLNADKRKFMRFNQRGDIAILNSRSLKLVDKFTHLKSGVSFTENDCNKRLTKAWTAIDRLSIISKSDLSDKIKRSFFFPSSTRLNTAILMHHVDAD